MPHVLRDRMAKEGVGFVEKASRVFRSLDVISFRTSSKVTIF